MSVNFCLKYHKVDSNFVHLYKKLDTIETINLSNNNLWSLPINTLCNLTKIRKLNISRNHLLNTVDLGLSFIGGCQVPLHELDVSHNHISSFSSVITRKYWYRIKGKTFPPVVILLFLILTIRFKQRSRCVAERRESMFSKVHHKLDN